MDLEMHTHILGASGLDDGLTHVLTTCHDEPYTETLHDTTAHEKTTVSPPGLDSQHLSKTRKQDSEYGDTEDHTAQANIVVVDLASAGLSPRATINEETFYQVPKAKASPSQHVANRIATSDSSLDLAPGSSQTSSTVGALEKPSVSDCTAPNALLSLDSSAAKSSPSNDFLDPLELRLSPDWANNTILATESSLNIKEDCEAEQSSAEEIQLLELLHGTRLEEGRFSGADMLNEHGILQREFERCWILNMSISFRDHTRREKFFVTYAENSSLWRRLTISIQHQDAPQDSLEAELESLHYQRDKSFCIYDALRDSLPTIQFFDTITNLKLVTDPEDGQLHVHVREDTNEVVDFPATSMFQHILCPRYSEDLLIMDSHISGFVYKVKLNDHLLVRKDIPSRDSVDEFLYELNALSRLSCSSHIIQLAGLVTDNAGTLVKGLLLHYAPGGSLSDILYEKPESAISNSRRERWASQITTGLAEIHEAGFVQGDFTLSNIVIDAEDDARIIDINRRGCPLGWEPPELLPIIQAGHRIAMYISAKTDLYQLGMVLWALAKHDDDPNQHEFGLVQELDVSSGYREVVSRCLSRDPRHRLSATQLISFFPPTLPSFQTGDSVCDNVTSHLTEPTCTPSGKTYIDPRLAVTIDEVRHHRKLTNWTVQSNNPIDDNSRFHSFESRASSGHRYQDSGMWSTPMSRGRTLHRDHCHAKERVSTATSGTSPSSLSTDGRQVPPRIATSPRHGTTEVFEAGSHAERDTKQPQFEPSPCTLCYRDSGFDELHVMVSEVTEPPRNLRPFSAQQTVANDPAGVDLSGAIGPLEYNSFANGI